MMKIHDIPETQCPACLYRTDKMTVAGPSERGPSDVQLGEKVHCANCESVLVVVEDGLKVHTRSVLADMLGTAQEDE